jgi:DNA polymerase III delta prime subunit
MDPIHNPFSPGAGSPPPELVGWEEILSQCEILLARVLKGRSEKSLLLTGLRGVGKTVLLNRMEQICESAGYHTILLEAHERKSLPSLLAPAIRSLLLKLDRLAGAKEKVRRAFAVLKSFVSSVTLTVDEIPIGIDINPEAGTADSGDLELDLPELLVTLAEVAKDRNTAIAILIDEVQYFNEGELSALIMGMHRMQQRQLPLVLIGAGLPILPRLAGESKSYAERLFAFPLIGPLPDSDAKKAIKDPILSEGADIQDDALNQIVSLTQGYPYFHSGMGLPSMKSSPHQPRDPRHHYQCHH